MRLDHFPRDILIERETTVYKVSRYLVISKSIYSDDSGVRLQLLYGTRTSHLIFVTPRIADALHKGNLEMVPPNWLAVLRDAQIIVPAEQDELSSILDRNREACRDVSLVQFGLLPTTYCNMGCAYCGQEHSRGGLTAQHRDRVRERVLRTFHQPSTTAARIDWFGGEPMMGYAVIRDLSKDFVRVADEREIRYHGSVTTNGSLLNSRNIDVLIRQCGISHFEITLDGPPDIHDIHRPLKSGRGSFWKIARTVRAAIDETDYKHVQFQFRTNVDVHNQDSIHRYIELMAELGFAKPNVSFSIQPVHSWGNDVSDIELNRKKFAERKLGWLWLMREYGLNFGTPLPTTPKTVICPAVSPSAELISGTGNIFSCSEQPLVPEDERTQALANINQENLPIFRPKGLFDDWHDEIEQGFSWCKDCVFLPTCGGSCPKLWHDGYPPCPSYKFSVDGLLDLLAHDCGLQPDAYTGQ